MPRRLYGSRRLKSGVRVFLLLSFISRLKLVSLLDVYYNTFDFLREFIVVRLFLYSYRIVLSGVREGVTKVRDLRVVILAFSAGKE